jgi:predicted membrane protein
VEVEVGVGEVQVDLRGKPKHDYDVRIRGGVGEATVRLPSDVGVYAEARGGIGEISAPGLRHDGERYYNEAYKKSPITVKLDVQGGVGSIKLISD